MWNRAAHNVYRSGRYKVLCTFATISSSICYLLLMLRWHGDTNWLESLYIVPGYVLSKLPATAETDARLTSYDSGFGTGIAQSALFISLQAVVSAEHMAPAVSMMYLSTRVCMMTGLVSSSATMRHFLRIGLRGRLDGLGLDEGQRAKIIAEAVSDVGYVNRTHGPLRQAVVGAYVDGLWYSHGKFSSANSYKIGASNKNLMVYIGLSLVFSLTGLCGTLLLRQRRLDQRK